MDAVALFVQPTRQCLRVGSSQGAKGHKGNQRQVQQQQKEQQQAPAQQGNLSLIMTELQADYDSYKYTVYRCASKFVKLQKVFHTAKIPYKLMLAVLERHGMHAGADRNLMVPPFQLTSLLHDMYYACECLGHFTRNGSYHLDTATALLANFFWNVYDPHRQHSISLLEIKVTFLLLCKLHSTEHLVTEFYQLVADTKTKCVTKFCFEYLLHTLCKLLTYIGEGKAYGTHNMQQVLEQCFARYHNKVGLTAYQFHCLWTRTQTRFLIYANLVALIKRIEDTEHLIHNKNACFGCRMEQIIGIRFKCQTCRDYSLCLRCFASGQVSGNHELAHRMFEVFGEDQPAKKFSYYLARLCSFFNVMQKTRHTESSTDETKGFCNAQESSSSGEASSSVVCSNMTLTTGITEMASLPIEHRDKRLASIAAPATGATATIIETKAMTPMPKQTTRQELTSLTGLATTATNASGRLQAIIERLQQQNAKLETQLRQVPTSTHAEISEFLNAHQTFLIDIIGEMRELSLSASATAISHPGCLACSTPHRANQEAYLRDEFIAELDDRLTHSINGADLNRSYLEANKSDYSISDLSFWFDQRRISTSGMAPTPLLSRLPPLLETLPEEGRADNNCPDSDMINFKLLLNKVKEIVEDSYSENIKLSAATHNLENVLDHIIQNEELRRYSS